MKFLRLVLVLMIVAIPLSAYGQKARTIDELAKMYDSSNCKSCHAEIYAQWEKSHHARPLMGVKGGLMLTPLALKKGTPGATAFSEDDPGKLTIRNFPCFKCHLPQAVISAEDSVAAELAKALQAAASPDATDKVKADTKATVAKLQITCIVCHNTKAIIHKRELGEPVPGVIYSSKDNAGHPGGKIVKSAIFKDSIYCGQCHGLGPNLEFDQPFQCANLYGSYLHNYVSGGGTQSCQDCHMKKGDHLIPPNFNDDKQTSELLAQALSLDVQTLGYEWLRKAGDYTSKAVVTTRIRSSAGHRIPDG